MSDESAADEMPPTVRSGGRKSINKGRWSKNEVSKRSIAKITVCVLYCCRLPLSLQQEPGRCVIFCRPIRLGMQWELGPDCRKLLCMSTIGIKTGVSCCVFPFG